MVESKTRNIHIEALARSLGAPSLDGLAYALRHPETWPKGFVWDFNECSRCAMGLAHALWGDAPVNGNNDAWTSASARLLAVPYEEADRIFYWEGYQQVRPKKFLGIKIGSVVVDADNVTPGMVADAIDTYIARAE